MTTTDEPIIAKRRPHFRRQPGTRNIQITADDLKILAFLAKHRFARADAIVDGWMSRSLQVGRPRSKIIPSRLIAMVISRNCGGGSAPSEALIAVETSTATGAVPVRGRACGEMPPSKETIRLPSWASSPRAAVAPSASRTRKTTIHRAVFKL